ncbi:hypothetical protein BDV23DRAFT_184825 [Aspergillus alliaceus]|uniref:Isochorismatase-like domain-containing protein n=1 Tax=Petromyces alliaceus TaxID=209559 RepID=A0A5N7C544_PETAA|nr:hypothetical protein BDV23DRAFT_184825 [Aspergillus alliaceus]
MDSHIAVVLIDPLNEFLHPDGKLYPRMKASLEFSNFLKHIEELVFAIRQAHISNFYSLHQISKEGTYFGWNHRNANHIGTRDHKVFDEAFGGQISKGFGLVFYIQILMCVAIVPSRTPTWSINSDSETKHISSLRA